MDPWLDDGVLKELVSLSAAKTTHQDLQKVDAFFLYHPDHYDERFLTTQRCSIFILDSKYNFLVRARKRRLYNIIKCVTGESSFGPTLTLFEPFSKHLYHESKVGSLIDSALLLTDNGSGLTAFNAMTTHQILSHANAQG